MTPILFLVLDKIQVLAMISVIAIFKNTYK